jgi:putative holliday junction resolvase
VGRILAIDFGMKRVGLAITDPLQIIATPLDTVANAQALSFLKNYAQTETVVEIVVGKPQKLDGSEAEILPEIEKFIEKLRLIFTEAAVHFQDERFTSKDAKRLILQSGYNKTQRRDKALTDRVSAVIILQEFMRAQGKWL